MKKKYTLFFLLVMCFFSISYSQVGINTSTPDESAALDIESTDKGLLIPRMTTAERTAITDPAKALMVYDLDEETYYYNEGDGSSPNWVPFLSNSEQRDNYVLVKDVSDFPTASGGIITLDENTLYEINGTITLSASINTNGAYIIGKDSGEDVLNYTGSNALFTGNKGGSFRHLTLASSGSGSLYNLSGSASEIIIGQNSIVSGFSSVGSISGYGIVFFNILQYVDNTNGITYSNIGNLLLNNQAWLDSNTGTFEKFTGTFTFIEKISGFSSVPSGATGIDVNTSGLTVGEGILNGTVFSGAGTYVNSYPSSETYTGYNFSNDWSVNSPGIPRESDDVASGSMTLSAPVGSGELTSFTGTGTSSRKKISGTTSSANLFRFVKEGNNRLRYKGNKTRFFNVNVSMSYQATADLVLILYIAKNGTVIENTKVYGKGASGFFVSDAGILALPIVASIELNKDDYIEVWGERYSGSGSIQTVSLSLSIN